MTGARRLFIAGLCLLGVVQCIQQRLIVLLLDGVRWDYVKDQDLKGFRRIAKEGVTVRYVTPIFPANSYPNWYAIATGLYGESHGMVDNYMYDPERNDTFKMAPHPNATHEHWWNKTEPIWVSAEKNGKRAAMHNWDGCQVTIHGVKPMICEPYREFWYWTGVRRDTLSKLYEVLDWFEELETHQLAMVYYEGPDAYGHKYGPESTEIKQEMRDTDKMLDKFQDRLEASPIKDQVNFIVVSDHGMTDTSKSQKIPLEDKVNIEDISQTLNGQSEGGIIPVEGKGDQVYTELKNQNIDGLHVYKKEEIPEEYRLRNGQLTTPILLVADIGYVMLMPNNSSNVSKGIHGYDPFKTEKDDTNQMRTIMYARGPAFQRGVKGQPIYQTDHYNIFCHILNLEPHPNNGSWDRIKDLLVISAANTNEMALILLTVSVATILLLSCSGYKYITG